MTSATSSVRDADSQLVAAATQLIRERLWRGLRRPITVEEIATGCGVSVRRLQRAFYRESPTGEPLTFQQTLATERMLAARSLLRSRRRISAPEAARRVGYRDVAQFTRAYRLRFGVTPAADRHAAGGRARGGPSSGAAHSQRSRRERRRLLATEAQFRDAEVAATAAVFGLSDEDTERAGEMASEQGLAAMHRWVRVVHAARVEVEQAEWRAQMAMLETSVILRRSELLREPIRVEIGSGGEEVDDQL